MKRRLKLARVQLGLTQMELRKRTDIHQSKISAFECGYINPTPDERKRLAEALGLRPYDLKFGDAR